MTNTVKHTPTPWKLIFGYVTDKDDRTEIIHIADIMSHNPNMSAGEAKSNAEFIVRACNSHYELLEALKSLVLDHKNKGIEDVTLGKIYIQRAEEAIAKAEGKF